MDGGGRRGATVAELRRRVESLGPWFHDLELGGIRTAPDHPLGPFLEELWGAIRPLFPEDLDGRTVLDIGCNGGYYALKLCERGARVTGIDHDLRYLEQARLAAEVTSADLELFHLDVYDVDRLGRTFDYVLFMGVFYHLRHPLYALEKVARTVRERLVFQTLVRGAEEPWIPAADYPFEERAVFTDPRFPALYFVENRYAGDPTNWWIPNESAAAAMLRSVGLVVERRVGPGLYACAPGRS